jgi:hypothetical protein
MLLKVAVIALDLKAKSVSPQQLRLVLEVDIGQRVAISVADDVSGVHLVDGPGGGKRRAISAKPKAAR